MKFRALLLLKDLIKGNYKNLIAYNDKKLLDRLYLLATSKYKEKCLISFNKRADMNYSKKFYHLLLECFNNWGRLFKDSNPRYFDFYNKLRKIKRIPV